MTTDRYAKLWECVEKATPGEWVFDNEDGYGGNNIWAECSPTGHGAAGPLVASAVGDSAQAEANGEYIAAASPATIRALLAERDRLREVVFHTISFIEAILAGVKGPDVDGGPDLTFKPGVSDVQLTPDGSYKLSQARAALSDGAREEGK